MPLPEEGSTGGARSVPGDGQRHKDGEKPHQNGRPDGNQTGNQRVTKRATSGKPDEDEQCAGVTGPTRA